MWKERKEEAILSGVLLGIMYGRGTASVAEQLHMKTEEAQEIIDNFFDAYPLIKQFIEEQQAKTHKLGYTTTAWRKKKIYKTYNR